MGYEYYRGKQLVIIHFLAEGGTEFKFIEYVLIPYLINKNNNLNYSVGIHNYIKNLQGATGLSPISKFYEITLNTLLGYQKKTDALIITSIIDLVGQEQHFCSANATLVDQNLSAQYPVILNDSTLSSTQKAKKIEDLLFCGLDGYLNSYLLRHQLSDNDSLYLRDNLHKVKYHIQPHEFEALFFSDLERFFLNSVPNNLNIRADIHNLQKQVSHYLQNTERCESINNNRYPACWLEDYLGYDKKSGIQYQHILYNYDLYQLINIIREHCPHFNNWVDYLCQIS